MKPHPRPPIIRKTIKWAGAAVTVLLVVVWIGSGWFVTMWQSKSGRVMLGSGRLQLTNAWDGHYSLPLGGHFHFIDFQLFFHPYCPYFGFVNAGIWAVVVPLWMPTGLWSIGTAIAWERDSRPRRRAKRGLNLCPKCNYDRTGLVSKDGGGAKCPECGAVPASV